MKVVAYNAIIMLCHLVEVAIFAISDFLSLFSLAIFNIPISHNCCFVVSFAKLLLFSLFPIFFNIFLLIACGSHGNSKFCFACVPPFSGAGVSAVRVPVVVVCPDDYCYTYAHTHARAYTRARGFLDSNF